MATDRARRSSRRLRTSTGGYDDGPRSATPKNAKPCTIGLVLYFLTACGREDMDGFDVVEDAPSLSDLIRASRGRSVELLALQQLSQAGAIAVGKQWVAIQLDGDASALGIGMEMEAEKDAVVVHFCAEVTLDVQVPGPLFRPPSTPGKRDGSATGKAAAAKLVRQFLTHLLPCALDDAQQAVVHQQLSSLQNGGGWQGKGKGKGKGSGKGKGKATVLPLSLSISAKDKDKDKQPSSLHSHTHAAAAVKGLYDALKPAPVAPLARPCPSLDALPCLDRLSSMPEEVQRQLANFLGARSLRALSASSRRLHDASHGLVPGLLLDLFPHQKRGLAWMVRQETTHGHHHTSNDPHPFFARLPGAAAQGLWIDLLEGGLLCSVESLPRRPPPVRGGLFCDEPGLGKTITVLALMLKSKGCLPDTTAFAQRHKEEEQGRWDHAEAVWALTGTEDAQFVLRKLLRGLEDGPEGACVALYEDLSMERCEAWGMPDYKDLALPTGVPPTGVPLPGAGTREGQVPGVIMDLAAVRERINQGRYHTVRSFLHDCRTVFQGGVRYHTHPQARRPSPHTAQASVRVLALLEQAVNNLVLQLAPGDKEVTRLHTLLPSAATLVVCPLPMVQHWSQQMKAHSKPRALGRVFVDDGGGGGVGQGAGGDGDGDGDTAAGQYNRKGGSGSKAGAAAAGWRRLPPAEELAAFSVVVLSSARLTREEGGGCWEESPLCRIFWARLVVDEGHSLGVSHKSMATLMAGRLLAERRWIMTGTPTPNKRHPDAALAHLENLLVYLGEGSFGQSRAAWRRLVVLPFMAGGAKRKAAMDRLRGLLQGLMVRHTREDLRDIPPPERRSTLLDMSPHEVVVYNTMVSFIRVNILLTATLKGRTSAWQDSVLNPLNAKHAMTALTNVRIACCGGGRLKPVLSNAHYAETETLLRQQHGHGEESVQRILSYLRRARGGGVSKCDKCSLPLQLLLLTPCAHLLCLQCVGHASFCALCEAAIDPDDLQRLQPGFDLQWDSSQWEQGSVAGMQAGGGGSRERRRSGGARGGSRSDHRIAHMGRGGSRSDHRIAHMGSSSSHMGSSSSSHMGSSSSHMGSSSSSQMGSSISNGSSGSGVDGGRPPPPFPPFPPTVDTNAPASPSLSTTAPSPSPSPFCLHQSTGDLSAFTKADHVLKELKRIRAGQSAHARRRQAEALRDLQLGRGGGGEGLTGLRRANSRAPKPLKAIIFSQFRHILDRVGDKCYREFGGAPLPAWLQRGEEQVAEFFGKQRNLELAKFRHSPSCFVLLLGKEGAHGLDLSFVTHIFLMEEIWDKALEQQVVARAHRMGAGPDPVVVEQLILRGTTEEQIRQITGRGAGVGDTGTGTAGDGSGRGAGHADDDGDGDGDDEEELVRQAKRAVQGYRRGQGGAEAEEGGDPPLKGKGGGAELTRRRRQQQKMQRGKRSGAGAADRAKVQLLLTRLELKLSDHTEDQAGDGKGEGGGEGEPTEPAQKRKRVTFADVPQRKEGHST